MPYAVDVQARCNAWKGIASIVTFGLIALMTAIPGGPAFAEDAPVLAKPSDGFSSICVEAETGLVISEHNADTLRPPASMVKMMQMLLVCERLEKGECDLTDTITVTEHAQSMGGSQLALEKGEVFTLNQLMSGVCVASANDGAMAVAEGVWKTEDAYKKLMNARAQELGMTNTTFHSVHGLPPDKGDLPDATTARDMSKLARACVKHSQILAWTSQKNVKIRPTDGFRLSTNKLLSRVEGCDGLKTGFTYASGFCITATAKRGDLRLIAVVMGVPNANERFRIAEKLLEQGFESVFRKTVLAKGELVKAPVTVSNSKTPEVWLAAADDLSVLVKKDDADHVKVVTDSPELLQAPIEAGTPVGEVKVCLADATLGSVALVVPTALEKADLRWKLYRTLRKPSGG